MSAVKKLAPSAVPSKGGRKSKSTKKEPEPPKEEEKAPPAPVAPPAVVDSPPPAKVEVPKYGTADVRSILERTFNDLYEQPLLVAPDDPKQKLEAARAAAAAAAAALEKSRVERESAAASKTDSARGKAPAAATAAPAGTTAAAAAAARRVSTISGAPAAAAAESPKHAAAAAAGATVSPPIATAAGAKRTAKSKETESVRAAAKAAEAAAAAEHARLAAAAQAAEAEAARLAAEAERLADSEEHKQSEAIRAHVTAIQQSLQSNVQHLTSTEEMLLERHRAAAAAAAALEREQLADVSGLGPSRARPRAVVTFDPEAKSAIEKERLLDLKQVMNRTEQAVVAITLPKVARPASPIERAHTTAHSVHRDSVRTTVNERAAATAEAKRQQKERVAREHEQQRLKQLTRVEARKLQSKLAAEADAKLVQSLQHSKPKSKSATARDDDDDDDEEDEDEADLDGANDVDPTVRAAAAAALQAEEAVRRRKREASTVRMNLLKSMMPSVQIDENKKIWTRMKHKLNLLRNPRFDEPVLVTTAAATAQNANPKVQYSAVASSTVKPSTASLMAVTATPNAALHPSAITLDSLLSPPPPTTAAAPTAGFGFGGTGGVSILVSAPTAVAGGAAGAARALSAAAAAASSVDNFSGETKARATLISRQSSIQSNSGLPGSALPPGTGATGAMSVMQTTNRSRASSSSNAPSVGGAAAVGARGKQFATRRSTSSAGTAVTASSVAAADSAAPPPPPPAPLFFSPAVIHFSEYEAGQTYTRDITITNRSITSRRFRVLPSTSPYFAVRAAKFTSSTGLLASGVSAVVKLTFTPDSLGEFRFEVNVATDTGRLLVPVLARRAVSVLSGLAERVSCGPCLVGDTTSIQLKLTNASRAPAKFWFAPDTLTNNISLMPSASGELPLGLLTELSTKSDVEKLLSTPLATVLSGADAALTIDGYTFTPRSFGLAPAESLTIQIRFAAAAAGHHSVTALLMCDDLTIRRHRFEGDGCAVTLGVSATDGQVAPTFGSAAAGDESLFPPRPTTGASVLSAVPSATGSLYSAADAAAVAMVDRSLAGSVSLKRQPKATSPSRYMSLSHRPKPSSAVPKNTNAVGAPFLLQSALLEQHNTKLAHGASAAAAAAAGANAGDAMRLPLQSLNAADIKIDSIVFDDLTMNGRSTKTLTLHNSTPVPLPFRWNFSLLPDFFAQPPTTARSSDTAPAAPAAAGGSSPMTRTVERLKFHSTDGDADDDDADDNQTRAAAAAAAKAAAEQAAATSVFGVTEAEGVFAPNSSRTFTFSFSPPQPGLFRSRATLQLHSLPASTVQAFTKLEPTAIVVNAAPPPPLATTPPATAAGPNRPSADAAAASADTLEVRWMTLTVQGRGVGCRVSLEPPVVLFGVGGTTSSCGTNSLVGSATDSGVRLGQPIRRTVQLVNRSDAPALFRFVAPKALRPNTVPTTISRVGSRNGTEVAAGRRPRGAAGATVNLGATTSSIGSIVPPMLVERKSSAFERAAAGGDDAGGDAGDAEDDVNVLSLDDEAVKELTAEFGDAAAVQNVLPPHTPKSVTSSNAGSEADAAAGANPTTAPFLLTVEPSEGQLAPHESLSVEIELTLHSLPASAAAGGLVHAVIPCLVRSMGEDAIRARRLLLKVEAKPYTGGPRGVRFDTKKILDFGMINFGLPNPEASTIVTLRSTSTHEPAPFSLCERGLAPPPFPMSDLASHDAADAPDRAAVSEYESRRFSFRPLRGVLLPGAAIPIQVTFRPSKTEHTRSHIEAHLQNGVTQYIAVRAIVQAPQLAFSPSPRLSMGSIFATLPHRARVQLRNWTTLPGRFVWAEQDPDSRHQYSVRFDPPDGTVPSHSTLDIDVHFTAHVAGSMRLLWACELEGVDLPLVCECVVDARPLAVSYHVPGQTLTAPPSLTIEALVIEQKRLEALAAATPVPPPPVPATVVVVVPAPTATATAGSAATTARVDGKTDDATNSRLTTPQTGRPGDVKQLDLSSRLGTPNTARTGTPGSAVGTSVTTTPVVSARDPTETDSARQRRKEKLGLDTKSGEKKLARRKLSKKEKEAEAERVAAEAEAARLKEIDDKRVADLEAIRQKAIAVQRALIECEQKVVASRAEYAERMERARPAYGIPTDSSDSQSTGPAGSPAGMIDRETLASIQSLDTVYPFVHSQPLELVVPSLPTATAAAGATATPAVAAPAPAPAPAPAVDGASGDHFPPAPAASRPATAAVPIDLDDDGVTVRAQPSPVLPVLDFGSQCAMFGEHWLDLIIRNHTAIPTEFDLNFVTFGIDDPAFVAALTPPPDQREDGSDATDERKAPNRADGSVKALRFDGTNGAEVLRDVGVKTIRGIRTNSAGSIIGTGTTNTRTNTRDGAGSTVGSTISAHFRLKMGGAGSATGKSAKPAASTAAPQSDSTLTSRADIAAATSLTSAALSTLPSYMQSTKASTRQSAKGGGPSMVGAATRSTHGGSTMMHQIRKKTDSDNDPTHALGRPLLRSTFVDKSLLAQQQQLQQTVANRTGIRVRVVDPARRKTQQRLFQKRASASRGVAFACYPSRCELPPFGVTSVRLLCVNEMCGVYSDQLRVSMRGQQPVLLPVRVTVVGSPLAFAPNITGLVLPGAPSGAALEAAAAAHALSNTLPARDVAGTALLSSMPRLSWLPQLVRSGRHSKTLRLMNAGNMNFRVTWSATALREIEFDRFVGVRVLVPPSVGPDGTIDVQTVLEPYSYPIIPPPTNNSPNVATAGSTAAFLDRFPFTVEPAELFVPAQGYVDFTVTFVAGAAPCLPFAAGGTGDGFLAANVFVSKVDLAQGTSLLIGGSPPRQTTQSGISIVEVADGDSKSAPAAAALATGEFVVHDVPSPKTGSTQTAAKSNTALLVAGPSALSQIDSFEASLQRRQAAKSGDATASKPASPKTPPPSKSVGAPPGRVIGVSEKFRRALNVADDPDWVLAPVTTIQHSLRLGVSARSVVPAVVVDHDPETDESGLTGEKKRDELMTRARELAASAATNSVDASGALKAKVKSNHVVYFSAAPALYWERPPYRSKDDIRQEELNAKLAERAARRKAIEAETKDAFGKTKLDRKKEQAAAAAAAAAAAKAAEPTLIEDRPPVLALESRDRLSQSISVTNRSAAALKVRVRVEPNRFFTLNEIPAHMAVAAGVAPPSNTTAAGVPPTALLSKQSTVAIAPDTALQLTPLTNLVLGVTFAPPKPDTNQWPTATRATIDGAVIVSYENGDAQTIPLQAILYRPLLRVSPDVHDFGSLHVKTEASKARITIQLVNPSQCDASWKLVHVPRTTHPSAAGAAAAAARTAVAPSTMSPSVLKALSHPDFDRDAEYADEPSLFVFSAQLGVVPADTLLSATAPIERQPRVLTVTFQPLKAGKFLSHFAVVVCNGANSSDRGIPIRLKAEASHHEHLDRYHE